jgi:transposase
MRGQRSSALARRESDRRLPRRYDETFRQDALALIYRTNRSLPSLAKDLGVPHTTLHNWYRSDMAKKGKGGKKPSRGVTASAALRHEVETADEKLARLESENAALRRENDDLKMDRAILKKAAAFFAKESE